MNYSLRFFACLAFTISCFSSALTVGCAASADPIDDTAESEADITGSLVNAQACAVKDAYVRASVADFEILTSTNVPFPVHGLPVTASPVYTRFHVEGVGPVYYIEFASILPGDGGTTTFHGGRFYDPRGRLLVLHQIIPATQASYFYVPGAGATKLSCGGGSGTSSSGWSSSTSGWSSSSSTGGLSSGWSADGGVWGSSGGSSSGH